MCLVLQMKAVAAVRRLSPSCDMNVALLSSWYFGLGGRPSTFNCLGHSGFSDLILLKAELVWSCYFRPAAIIRSNFIAVGPISSLSVQFHRCRSKSTWEAWAGVCVGCEDSVSVFLSHHVEHVEHVEHVGRVSFRLDASVVADEFLLY